MPLVLPRHVVLRAEGDPRVDVATLGVEQVEVHRGVELGIPRWHQLLVEDVIPVFDSGKEGMILDGVGTAGNDFAGFGKLQRTETLRLI